MTEKLLFPNFGTNSGLHQYFREGYRFEKDRNEHGYCLGKEFNDIFLNISRIKTKYSV